MAVVPCLPTPSLPPFAPFPFPFPFPFSFSPKHTQWCVFLILCINTLPTHQPTHARTTGRAARKPKAIKGKGGAKVGKMPAGTNRGHVHSACGALVPPRCYNANERSTLILMTVCDKGPPPRESRLPPMCVADVLEVATAVYSVPVPPLHHEYAALSITLFIVFMLQYILPALTVNFLPALFGC